MTIMMRMPMSKRVKYVGVTSRPLLAASDFAYQGYYTVAEEIAQGAGGGILGSGKAFTMRYVGGALRYMSLGYTGSSFSLVEWAKPSSYGDYVSTYTNVWTDIGNPFYDVNGLTWDETKGGLFSTVALDYPNTVPEETDTKSIGYRTLNSNGTISGYHGRIGLQGINARRTGSGLCRIPTWFQSTYGVGAFSVGFGGYHSRGGEGPVSMGPSMYAIPDPTGYSNDTEISSGSFKTLMDHSTGWTSTDWYGGSPTTFDRGIRFNTDVDNEYDSGEWTSPAPDGYGRWVWGDTCGNTACWIDNDAGTRTKHGFILVPRLMTGRAWYEFSRLNCEDSICELQIFNPAHLGECANGGRNAWNVQPVEGKQLTETVGGIGLAGHPISKHGAAFDPSTNLLHVYISDFVSGDSRIFVYSVGGA